MVASKSQTKNVINPICTETDYQAALARAKIILQAQAGTPELGELDELATLIEAYEFQHYPISDLNAGEYINYKTTC